MTSTTLSQAFLNKFPTPHYLTTPITYQAFCDNKETFLPILKTWLLDLDTYLHQLLIHQPNQTEMTKLMPSLLTCRTQIMDDILSKLFTLFNHNSSLFALGGYARNEVFPYSDLDILIIYDDNHTIHRLQEFIALLWDIGLNPAVRIHHSDDKACVGDITIATSLLENRFLAGNQHHQALPLTWLKSHYTPSEFFKQKFAEYQTRHNKRDNSEYVLEPNIKEGVGGLRDIHFLHWIGKFYFELPPTATLQALVSKGFLTQNECNELIDAKHFLWLIRHHLHTLSNKDNNKLDFGSQKTIAKLLNYPNKDNQPNYAPECLMKAYYRAVMSISSLSEYLGQLFFNEFLNKVNKQKLTDDYFFTETLFGEQLGIYDIQLFEKNPSQILMIFLMMGEHGIKNLTPKTLRALRNSTHLIDTHFLNNPTHRSLFIQNLDEPNYLFHRLRVMKRTGILGAYLPDFANITGLMQYDLFHRYTVDAHTLLLIRILHRFYQDDFGLLSTVYKELDNPLILVIAGIFHDIAKGQDGDHSELGAVLVAQFCQAHNINPKDTKLAEWLVQHHLVMSVTAQKKDIYDPRIIDEFANFVRDARHLDYLYVLTVADMNATNSQLWNNWRATLLKQLYLSTHAKFDQTSDTSPNAIIAQKKAVVLEKIEQKQAIEEFWQGLPTAYFLRQSKSELLWHAQSLLEHNNKLPLVQIIPHKNKSLHAHKLFIYTPNLPSLFALTVVILDKFGFAVYSADILTDSRDFALDTFVIVNKQLANQSIVSPSSRMVADAGNIKKLTSELATHLQNPNKFFEKTALSLRYVVDKLRHFDIKTQVFFENNNQVSHNLHITTKDRPSLLARIGLIFWQLNLSVHSAKITTLGERAEDVFVVSEPFDQPLSPDRQQQIIKTLKTMLDD